MSTTSSIPPVPKPAPPSLSFCLKPDGRQVLSRKRARDLLAPLSQSPYTSISLGGCALGDSAAGIAGPALLSLANNKCVRSVTFADCIASLPSDEALRSLSTLASSIGVWKGLRAVDLSYNALGSRGVCACAPLLQGQKKLCELRLIDSGLAVESARLLQGYLCVGPVTQLRVLELHANRLESAGVTCVAAILDKSPALERLRLSSLGAQAVAIQAVARALRGKRAMRDLDLSDNLLDVDAATQLGDVLGDMPALERLVLRDLNMGDAALAVLVPPLEDAQCALVELALAGNELGGTAGKEVGRLLRRFAGSLQVLDVSRNELGAEGVDAMTDALTDVVAGEGGGGVALASVLVTSNRVPALAVVRLALRLVALPGLQCFDVSGNDVPQEVLECVATALGSHIVLCDVPETDEGAGVTAGGATGRDEVEPVQSDDALRSALEDLANAPAAEPREAVQEVEEVDAAGSEVEEGAAEDGTALTHSQSTASNSRISRLVSLFSRGSEDATSATSSPRPANEVEGVTSTAPVQRGDGAGCARAAVGRSFEEDSGQMTDEEEEEIQTPRPIREEDMGGVTALSLEPGVQGEFRVGQEEDSPYTPTGNTVEGGSNADVILSAKKLKESIASLSKEISDVAGELQVPMVSSAGQLFAGASGEGDGEAEMSEYLLVRESARRSRKQTGLLLFVDVLGGLLVGTFVLILVLAIVQAQEESTFAYRFV